MPNNQIIKEGFNPPLLENNNIITAGFNPLNREKEGFNPHLSETPLLLSKILSECFWGDYSFTEDDIINIIKNGSKKEKQFLFGKIIQNANFVSQSLSIFSLADLKWLFDEYKITFNKVFIQRRIALAKAILLKEYDDEILDIYKWKN